MYLLSILYFVYRVFPLFVNQTDLFSQKNPAFLPYKRLPLQHFHLPALTSAQLHATPLSVYCRFRPAFQARSVLFYLKYTNRKAKCRQLPVFFFERKLVYPFAFVSFSASFCLCIVLFLKFGFYFFLRNKVVFPSSHPFPTAVGANLVCLQPKPLPRFSGKVPHTENGHRRTLCPPATPACLFPFRKADFLSKKILPAAHPPHGTRHPPKPTYFHKKCFSFLLPSPANQLSFRPKPTFFQLIFMKLCRLSDEEKSGFP